MARIPLLGGAYKQASLIAGAQRCVNLYPEFDAERSQAPVQVTHYSRPGLTPLGTAPIVDTGRSIYVDSLGQLYAVISQNVYFINADYVFTLLGTLPSAVSTPVSFSDNGVTVFLVDGSRFGSQINMASLVMTNITDPNFLGATRNDFLDGFVIFNEPNTPNWYCTLLYSNVFNGLFFGTKTAWPDNIQTIIANERQAWILGKYKSEVWQNAGTFPFPFALLSGSIIEHGIAGPYAVTKHDVNIYWLSQSPEGARLAMRGAYLQAQRISNNAIEEEWLTYPRVDDCILATYQIRNHQFVEYHFPAADRTWVFDESTQEWHEKAAFDINGVQHRSIDLFKAYAYGLNVAQDWRTGQLYQVDEKNYSDNGVQIVYKRGMPHLVDERDFARQTVWRIIADMECGNGTGVVHEDPFSVGFSTGFGPVVNRGPAVILRISRNRGFSFNVHSIQTLGLPGGYNTKPTWNRCGVAYDMIVELEWEGPLHTALNGVFAVTEVHEGDN